MALSAKFAIPITVTESKDPEIFEFLRANSHINFANELKEVLRAWARGAGQATGNPKAPSTARPSSAPAGSSPQEEAAVQNRPQRQTQASADGGGVPVASFGGGNRLIGALADRDEG